ncbi:inorganic phosphate transporter [Algoriphagus sp.]|uniref:inorganic phosphate transporter n=1 Tax=Algoriphagus sp. TaxID=1872435 RepID=UPI00391C6F25
MIWIVLISAVAFFSYSNGANDNFKGFATLYGSGMLSYKRAITWATITTFLGSIAAIILAVSLVRSFSGRGLVADALVNDPVFALSVALGAAITVIAATKVGMPVSSTHAMVGALVGTGMVVSRGNVEFSKLATGFLLPLILTPICSSFLSFIFVRFQLKSTPTNCDCICLPETELLVQSTQNIQVVEMPTVIFDKMENCEQIPQQATLRFDRAKLEDYLHLFSAGLVSFARGLNDTPKIVALLILIPFLNIQVGMILVAVVMAIGGLINARKIAETMSHKMTTMTSRQGLSANLITSGLVIGASVFGLPASTTQVSVGSLAGMGWANGTANFQVFRQILFAWVLTLPLGAALAIAANYLMSWVF